MDKNTFSIGCGAGFSGDRLDAAEAVVDTLIANGKPAAMMFETIGERTLALGQLARRSNPDGGYEPMLRELLEPVLLKCVHHNIPIIGNFGVANPPAAARLIDQLGRELGLNSLRIALVEGDDLSHALALDSWQISEGDASLDVDLDKLISANVYLGAAEIVAALEQGAQIVVTGRVADPALALGPLVHHFGWAWDDWDKLAVGTLAGHLLECASHICGGYFADPGYKDVPNLANVGFPIAEVSASGEIVVSKAANTGGLVSPRTVKEQMIYEIHDPAAYLTPDVILDITQVTVEEIGLDQVSVKGALGKPRPDTLKATLSIEGGWLGEGEISYAGPNARARAELAANVLRQRVQKSYPDLPYRIDLIGLSSVFDSNTGALQNTLPPELEHDDVRVRLAISSSEREQADMASREVLNLYNNGPAGGGGVRWGITPRIKTTSYLVPREQIEASASFYEHSS